MSIELGPVWILGADAIGKPGQRRFRLFVQSALGSAIMWMEKEQLNSLSLTLDRFLAYLTEGQVLRTEARAGGQPEPGKMPPDFPVIPTYELRIRQMELGYDEDRTAFILSAIPMAIVMEDDRESQLTGREEEPISCLFNLRDAQALSSAISTIVSAGRPVCPLCHAPLDGGPHACARQNGHHTILQVEDGDEDDDDE